MLVLMSGRFPKVIFSASGQQSHHIWMNSYWQLSAADTLYFETGSNRVERR
jgi:hypothetical protein